MLVRRLILEEMLQVARIHRQSFDDRLPWLAGLHTPQEDVAYFRNQVFAECEVHGAEEAGRLIGFIAFAKDWIHQLYVLPQAQGKGAGSRLLAVAQAGANHLQLWTFEKNTGARAFYEARGFHAVRVTDGTDNEEKEPDVLYEWFRKPIP
jgi:GNAT superfamily N-acetyltransferase